MINYQYNILSLNGINMTFVITDNCENCRFTDCVTVCPVDCFHAGENMLYIDPDECIDCGACEPECPVEAIYEENSLPEDKVKWIKINAEQSGLLPVITDKEEPLSTAEAKKSNLGF